jgi:hypothetical protein
MIWLVTRFVRALMHLNFLKCLEKQIYIYSIHFILNSIIDHWVRNTQKKKEVHTFIENDLLFCKEQ